ncbi:MAG: tetratricopeptide repeat protein [Deltaproteobacteria bacterium]|nr:tetratricopeptide repeat protein [Deltaproteobacteria bacterium]
MRNFLGLPPAARAGSPLLPVLMRRLADAGRSDLALFLLAEEVEATREPARSEAFFEAGNIHRRRKEYDKAAEYYRRVSAVSAFSPGAAAFLSGYLAAGDAADAAAAFRPLAKPGFPSFPANALSLSRAGVATADPRDLKAAVDNMAAERFPERAATLEALAFALQARKDHHGSLAAAKEALSTSARWKTEAERRAFWDGTVDGADRLWKSLSALFPYDEDAGRFLAAGGRFLSASALHEGHRKLESEIVDLSRRIAAAKDGTVLRKRSVEGGIRRAGEIVKAAQDGGGEIRAMRERLRESARSLSLPSWGAKMDPRRSALIGKVDAKSMEIHDRIARIRTAADAVESGDSAHALRPDDRRMLLYARRRLAGIEDALYALEGMAAIRKAVIRNGWKAEYVARLSVQLEKAEIAAEAMAMTASKAQGADPSLKAAREELAVWEATLDAYRKRLDDDSLKLAGRKSETHAAARRELSGAVGELLAAIGRSEFNARYLAARAATEWRLEDRRQDLLAEAIGHWQAILPAPGDRGPVADEALYALAELRYEEEESRYLGKEEVPGGKSDYSVPASLFRRVIEEYPDSPYWEQAAYGLALSFQENGEADNAVMTMKALLARNPGTRFADEINLRLGEYAFDEYDFPGAEESYGRVSGAAAPEIRSTALFKAGWSIFLQGRPREAVEPFLSSILLSPDARRTGGVPAEALAMAARSLVEGKMDVDAEALLERRGGSAYAPALLLLIQDLQVTQNHYAEAVSVADRLGRKYSTAAERIAAEMTAADALLKAGREEESHARKAKFHLLFGTGSAWRAHTLRTREEAVRADAVSEEALRTAAFYFHARSRQSPPGDRRTVLSLYDASLSLYPSSPKAEEIAYQRAWLLFEDGSKREAAAAFEAVALRPRGARGEASRYMAVQSAKDVSSPADAPSREEVIRLCREYERSFPRGERIYLVSMDRARAHANLRQPVLAAEAADRAAVLARTPVELRAALRLAGDAYFEKEDFAEAEKAFRALLAAGPAPEEAKEAAKWIGFSLFRRAEKLPSSRAAEAAAIFSAVDREFPSLEIAPVARLRAGTAYAQAGKSAEAVAALLTVESSNSDPDLSIDATRRLASIFEKAGNMPAAGDRYERLASVAGASLEDRTENLLRAAGLFSRGKDEQRARKNLAAAAGLPGITPALRVQCLFRAGESARAEGRMQESDRYYGEAVSAHDAAPEAAPALAGSALFQRAEFRLRKYRELSIAPPFEKSFPAKQGALEVSANLYVEAIRWGDATIVSASLHRLGEAFEDFRSAILSSPPPKGLSDPERDEYGFLLEEKAAPIEEKAVEAYARNLRQAVAGDFRSEWVEKSLQRLKALRPARYGKKGEYAFPVLAVPVFRGIIERSAP